MTMLDANGLDPRVAQLKADFNSHRIDGFAREDPTQTHFDVPLVTHVKGNLWQGGCIGGTNLRGYFKNIVSLYPWERYNPGGELDLFVEARLYDTSEGAVPERQIYALATLVHQACQKGPTLVHCQAGLNRSGLVAGLSLVIGGMEPPETIQLLRASRCEQVLCNRKFFSWLLKQRPGNFSSASPSRTAKSKHSQSAGMAAAGKTPATQA